MMKGLFLFFLILSLNGYACGDRICLIESQGNCLKETEDFCRKESSLPVTRPISFEGEVYQVYIDKEWNQKPLGSLLYQLARDFKKTNKTEILIAEYYGISLLNLRAAMKMAQEVESELCSTHHSINDEADAIRHFTLSSYLGYLEGRDIALDFLMGHEALLNNDLKSMKSFKRKMKSLVMDYYNNELGADFSVELPFYFSKQGVKKEIIVEIKNKLSQDEFYILNKNKPSCL